VDLFGPALQIIEWMGALAQVQDAGTHTEIMSFIRDGHRQVDVSAELSFEGVSERHVEIMRVSWPRSPMRRVGSVWLGLIDHQQVAIALRAKGEPTMRLRDWRFVEATLSKFSTLRLNLVSDVRG
jgi:hypothetical protein